MFNGAGVGSWLRVKGLDCIKQNQNTKNNWWEKEQGGKKSLPKSFSPVTPHMRQSLFFGNVVPQGVMSTCSPQFWQGQTIHFSQGLFSICCLRGLSLVFWQSKLLLLCDFWASWLEMCIFSSVENIHFDIFGIVPPIKGHLIKHWTRWSLWVPSSLEYSVTATCWAVSTS